MSRVSSDRIANEQVGAQLCVRLLRRVLGTDATESGDQHPSEFIGSVISRDRIDAIEYESVSDILQELRLIYSASGMRCLRSDAGSKKTPVLNLLRQVAKANGLLLVPSRKSRGYDAGGRKQFTYWYTVVALDRSESMFESTSHAPVTHSHTPVSASEQDIVEGTIILPPNTTQIDESLIE